MPDNQNRLSQFWQELKRRRVIHVITVYASVAFVIIELINNLTEPLNLPSSLATIVIILLGVGFPLAIVLSWIYDLTGEGFERTKPIEEVPEERVAKVPNAWKMATYISFVIIIGLLTFNIVEGTKGLKAGDIQSLVILPFDNYTGDNQLDHVAAGLHASLIGDMGKISSLRVISQTTAKVYKNMEISLSQIAKEADAEAIIEPSVMCYGDSVCIQIRVISMYPKEKQLWVEEYKEDKSQILNLYNKITKQIADEIMVELTPEEDKLLSKSRTVDREAYDDYIKSYAFYDDLSQEGLNKAMEYLNNAIKKEPDWAPLYAGLAMIVKARMQGGWEPYETGFPKEMEYINRAKELDPDIIITTVWQDWNWEKGEKDYRKALTTNPSDAMSRVFYAHLLCVLQRTDEALVQGRIAAGLDPLNPMIQSLYAVVLMCTNDWESVMDKLEEALSLDPDHFFTKQLMDIVAFHQEDYDFVFQSLKGFLPFPETFFDSIQTLYHAEGFAEAYERVVLEMENTGYGVPVDYAARYGLLHQYDKVLDRLEIGYEVHDPNMAYITTGFCSFDSLYTNPRFIALLKKMNLPLPDKLLIHHLNLNKSMKESGNG